MHTDHAVAKVSREQRHSEQQHAWHEQATGKGIWDTSRVQVSKLLRRKKDEFIPLVMSRTIELWTAVMAAERPEEFFGRAFWTAVMRGLSAFSSPPCAVEGN